MGSFPHSRFTAMTGAEIDQLAELVRGADLTVRVPWSRGWRLKNLVRHVGIVHRWATRLIVTEARGYRRMRDTDDWPGKPTADEAADWLLAERHPLLDALTSADPDKAMWAWGADKHVRFWSRRMTHETGVHRADAELTLGVAPRFTADIAVDGVSEFLDNLWCARAWRRDMRELCGAGERLELAASDTGDRWTVERTEDGFRWTHHPDGEPGPSEVRVSGSASDLYLLVWNRITPDAEGLAVTGDRALWDHWHRYSAV